MTQYQKNWNLELKLAALKHYGESCKCCGESWPIFLTLDHIKGGGNRHRKVTGWGAKFYMWLKKNHYPSGFQVLCHNCNWAKHLKKICPHKSTNGRLNVRTSSIKG